MTESARTEWAVEASATGVSCRFAPFRVLFRGGDGGVEGAVVGEEEFVDGGCGYTRLEVHPPLIQKLTVRPVGDADPGGRSSRAGRFLFADSVFERLRDFTLTSHLLEEGSQVIHQLGTAVLVDLGRDCVRSGCFPSGELLHGPDGFMERERKVDVHVGLYLRQTDDGGIGDGGGTVEDASELFGPTLENLRLLDQESTAVDAEERSGAFRRRTVDSFDSGENVLPSVAVRVS
ncbi:hypothetical protein SprV_0501892800 [Sparganum proliferum]